MQPVLHVQLTGRGLAIFLLILLGLLAALALVWLTVGSMLAIAAGLVLVLLIRGLLALFKPLQ